MPGVTPFGKMHIWAKAISGLGVNACQVALAGVQRISAYGHGLEVFT